MSCVMLKGCSKGQKHKLNIVAQPGPRHTRNKNLNPGEAEPVPTQQPLSTGRHFSSEDKDGWLLSGHPALGVCPAEPWLGLCLGPAAGLGEGIFL